VRLLMLNNEFPPLGGGTGTVNRALLERLAGSPGLSVDLVTSAPGPEPAEERFASNIRIRRLPVGTRDVHHASNRELVRYAGAALAEALRRHRARPYDLALAWSALPAGAVALALRRLTGLRYALRVCGPDIPGFERRYRPLYPVLAPVIRRAWRGAETVVAKCREEAAMIHAIDRRPQVELIPNGVDLAAFPPADPVPDEGPLRVLCVARLIGRKRQGDLIRAVGALRDRGIDARLELVGTGDARAAYQAEVDRLGLGDRVRFAGYVPREAIARVYRAAHVFALPSANEGMSVATLEAMAAGLPVVVTRTGGTAELVADGDSGLTFAVGDVAELARHLARLATDRAFARRAGAASRARAARFSWADVTAAYLDLFERLVPVDPARAVLGAGPSPAG
jgi:glycosyltransferase involved in cell wall biosynthesis